MKDLMKNYRSVFFATIALVGIFFYSCDPNVEEQDNSTFGLIQSKILTPNCAISGCHASVNDDSFAQHHLVLEKKVSYANLVNVNPHNANALADLMLRVKPNHSDESLLYHKLHGYDHHARDYGNPMPLGLKLLSEGQIEFVRSWIDAGAPQKGTVADADLLNDTTSQKQNFIPLPPPEAGKGFQIIVPKFSVAPNFEREFFVYKKLGNEEQIYVNRFEIKMRENSHHFVLYDFNSSMPQYLMPTLDAVRDIRNPDGTLNYLNMAPMAYHVFMLVSQTPYLDYSFPEGVAMSFPAGAAADFNSHYVNKQTKEISGEVYLNLHTVAAANVTKVAKLFSLSNQNLSLPALLRTTVSKTYLSDKKVSIISLTSHTHQLGEKFIIKIKGGLRDGEVVYTNTDWHHPDFITYNPPIIINAGEGLVSEITYNNTKTKTVTFGLTSEDEMGIIFGYYCEE